MGWDSNPRRTCAPAGFQDRCLQPLGHPSVSCRFWLRPLAYARLTFTALTLACAARSRLRRRLVKTGALNHSATHPFPAGFGLRRSAHASLNVRRRWQLTLASPEEARFASVLTRPVPSTTRPPIRFLPVFSQHAVPTPLSALE